MAEVLHQLIGSLSHYLQGYIHPRWWAGFLNHQQYVYPRRRFFAVGCVFFSPPGRAQNHFAPAVLQLRVRFWNSLIWGSSQLHEWWRSYLSNGWQFSLQNDKQFQQQGEGWAPTSHHKIVYMYIYSLYIYLWEICWMYVKYMDMHGFPNGSPWAPFVEPTLDTKNHGENPRIATE